MCIALSVSELVSAYPTSGGLYFTCKYLAPDRWMAEISWVCGWTNLLGQIAGKLTYQIPKSVSVPINGLPVP